MWDMPHDSLKKYFFKYFTQPATIGELKMEKQCKSIKSIFFFLKSSTFQSVYAPSGLISFFEELPKYVDFSLGNKPFHIPKFHFFAF